jgi:hypothetical protein
LARKLLIGRKVECGPHFRGTITDIELSNDKNDGSITIDFEACGCPDHWTHIGRSSAAIHHISPFSFAIGLNTEGNCGWVLDLRGSLVPQGDLAQWLLSREEYVINLVIE